MPERAGEVEFHCRGSHVASPLGIWEILVTDGCERAPHVAPLQKKELSHVRQLFFYNQFDFLTYILLTKHILHAILYIVLEVK